MTTHETTRERTLESVMTDEVLYLTPQDSAYDAAREMAQLNVGIIPICTDDRRLLGVVTDRDLVVRVIAEKKDPADCDLASIATMDPIAAQKEWTLAAAVELMSQYQIRRLPVVEDGKLTGIVSIGDLAVHSATDTGGALEEISRPAMPRRAGVDEDDQTA